MMKYLVLFFLFYLSCSKYDGDTIRGKDMKLEFSGLYDFECNISDNYCNINNELFICVNLPDSLKKYDATFYKYIVDYRVLNSKQTCRGDLGSIELRKIEIYYCRRK